ncbi:hypothetical protein ACKVM7_002483, partial [Arthrobacter russicus]
AIRSVKALTLTIVGVVFMVFLPGSGAQPDNNNSTPKTLHKQYINTSVSESHQSGEVLQRHRNPLLTRRALAVPLMHHHTHHRTIIRSLTPSLTSPRRQTQHARVLTLNNHPTPKESESTNIALISRTSLHPTINPIINHSRQIIRHQPLKPRTSSPRRPPTTHTRTTTCRLFAAHFAVALR